MRKLLGLMLIAAVGCGDAFARDIPSSGREVGAGGGGGGGLPLTGGTITGDLDVTGTTTSGTLTSLGGINALTGLYLNGGTEGVYRGTNSLLYLAGGNLVAQYNSGAVGSAVLYYNGANATRLGLGGKSGDDLNLMWLFANQNTDQGGIFLADDQGRQLVIADTASVLKDFDHPVQTNTTIYLHSATDPDTDNQQYLGMSHDTNTPVFETPSGRFQLTDGSNGMELRTTTDGLLEARLSDNSDFADIKGADITAAGGDLFVHNDGASDGKLTSSGTGDSVDIYADNKRLVEVHGAGDDVYLTRPDTTLWLGTNSVAAGAVTGIEANDNFGHFGIFPGSDHQNTIIVSTAANREKDHHLGAAANPAVAIFAQGDVDANANDYGLMFATTSQFVLGGGSSISSIRLDKQISTSFNIDTDGSFLAGNDAADKIGFTTKSNIQSDSNGTFEFQNGAETAGVEFDFSTDAVLKIRDRANATDADVEAGDLTLSGDLTVASFTDHIDIPAGVAPLFGGAAYVLTDTIITTCFDADAESASLQTEVPDNWDGVSDLKFKAYWTPEATVAMADTETVQFAVDYRSLDWGVDTYDNGTLVTVVGTYTQSGAGAIKETHVTEMTIDYDDANQPVAAGDTLAFKFRRNFTTDTYASDACILRWEVTYTATTFSNH